MYFSSDRTAQLDQIAGQMRDYYEANKPLRWGQRRRLWGSCEADDLMLGMLTVVLTSLTLIKQQQGQG